MKKLLLSALAAVVLASSADAESLAGKKIYLNPGHGGFEASAGTKVPGVFTNGYRSDGSVATDRWNATIPFPNVCEEGCWESKHNLWRGLELRRLLEEAGATVMMSRTENRPEDDRILVEIGREATSWQADMFLSIHSNGNGSNHLMTMYRGADPRPGQPFNINDPDIPASKEMARTGWKHLHDNLLTCWQAQKNINSPYAVSDSAFYSSWTDGYHLGVLREMWRPGYLAEIAFHDYKPEAHRMLSKDYSNIVAYQLYTGICDYFQAPLPTTGIIAGAAKDAKRILRDPLYLGATFGDHDQYKPINGAKVTLTGNGVNKTYTTDNYYNGIYYFPDLAPGTYHIKIEADGYTTYEEDVTCEAAKVRGTIAMLDDPDYDPAADRGRANVFASALEAVSANNIRFTLNADATSVCVNLLKNGSVVKTIDLGPQARGTVNTTIPGSELADGQYEWSITAKADPIVGEPVQFSENGDQMLDIANTRSVAIDRNPASPFFGRIYATSIEANGKKGARMGTGVYILDAAHTDITDQGNKPYQGGQKWAGNSSPMRLFVADDGKVYVCDWSDGHSGAWIIDPAKPEADFSPVFADGSRNADGWVTIGGNGVHGSIVDLCVTGTGADTKLYTADEDIPDKGFIARYDIGALEQPWAAAPSKIYGNYNGHLANTSQTISPDGRGGLWIGHNRDTNSDQYPSAIHINGKTGEYDYHCGNTAIFKTSTPMGALAVNHDGSLIAVAGKTDIRVAKVTFDANDKPSLELLYAIGSTYGSRPFDCEFDAADNLYVAYNDNAGGIGVWALPKEKNEYTTPARMPLNMSSGINATEVADTDIAYDGSTITAAGEMVEVFGISGTMVAKGYSIDATSLLPGVYVVRAGAKSLKIVK